MSKAPVEAIGGWLKDDDPAMDRRYRRLADIGSDSLKAEHLAYFEENLDRYFNDRLIPDQGVEEILEALRDHGGRPARWIDLGAGVTTLFWSIGVNAPQRVFACDLVPEALKVLSSFKDSGRVPPCYTDALALMARSKAEFEAPRRAAWSYHVFDCLNAWRVPGEAEGFDLVSVIGCLGLASDPAGYETAFRAAADNIAAGGRLVGADWIRSSMFVATEGHDNRYLSPVLTEGCAARLGLTRLQVDRVQIQGDPYYDAVIVWAYSRGD